MLLFMEETHKHEHLRFDWFGFIALAIGIGSLQLLLDRGEQVGWFGANEIWIELIVAVTGFYYFFAHSLTTPEPFIRFDMFKDRNFVSGCLFMLVIGVVLFGTMALITPFMQTLLGYPIQTAGFLLGSRGIGTLLTMMAAPRLMRMVESRYLILCGLLAVRRHALRDDRILVRHHAIHDRHHQRRAGRRPSACCSCRSPTWRFRHCPAICATAAPPLPPWCAILGSSVGISMVIANLTSMTTRCTPASPSP